MSDHDLTLPTPPTLHTVRADELHQLDVLPGSGVVQPWRVRQVQTTYARVAQDLVLVDVVGVETGDVDRLTFRKAELVHVFREDFVVDLNPNRPTMARYCAQCGSSGAHTPQRCTALPEPVDAWHASSRLLFARIDSMTCQQRRDTLIYLTGVTDHPLFWRALNWIQDNVPADRSWLDHTEPAVRGGDVHA
jgi:hypothetical protein